MARRWRFTFWVETWLGGYGADCNSRRFVGKAEDLRVLVCFDGPGQVELDTIPYAVGKGEIWPLPVEAGGVPFDQAEKWPCRRLRLLDSGKLGKLQTRAGSQFQSC